MYEPSKHLATFNVAGFQYWDGARVLGELKAGKRLKLVPEPDNPHDPSAIALYYHGAKLGYVPAKMNEPLATFLHFGHRKAVTATVLQVNKKADPWEQVRVALSVVDARKKHQ